MKLASLDPKLRSALESIYEEVMWLSKRPNVTPGRARAWYTHIMAESVKRKLRRFTGQVSAKAVEATAEPLMLEHFMRIQTTLSQLVERHRTNDLDDRDDFLNTLLEFEQVHIVTRSENYDAMRAKGNYEQAGIKLVLWPAIPTARQRALWNSMLRGKVANSSAFIPSNDA
jgi:hypothetical protein